MFDLSTRVVAGNESDIKHITVEIRSPDRQLLLVGYLAGDHAAERIERWLHRSRRASGRGTDRHRVRRSRRQRFRHRPRTRAIRRSWKRSSRRSRCWFPAPRSIVRTASSSRLHPSSQDSLQKSRQFVCQFAVPRTFRGDYVQLTCTAVGNNRGAGSIARQRSCGRLGRAIPLVSIATVTARPAALPMNWPSGRKRWPISCCGRPIWPGRTKSPPGGTPSARR